MKQITLVIAILLSFNVFADERYICKQGNQERIIDVVYEFSDSKLPCEVIYQKSATDIKTLWSAENTEGYCEEKASEFVKKQTNWGWDCSVEK